MKVVLARLWSVYLRIRFTDSSTGTGTGTKAMQQTSQAVRTGVTKTKQFRILLLFPNARTPLNTLANCLWNFGFLNCLSYSIQNK